MKKLHRTGSTILLALAPAAALGITAGVIVANWPKSEAQPIVDPKMSGEVDIEVTTDGRGYTECKLTSKETTKRVASVSVAKGGVTLEDKEISEEKWFTEYQTIRDAYQSTTTTFKNGEVTIKVNSVEPRILCIDNDMYDEGRKSGLSVYFDAASEPYTYWYQISGPTIADFREWVEYAEESGFKCIYEIEDAYLSITIPSYDDTYTKYVINRDGYITKYEEKDYSGEIETYTLEYNVAPHSVTEFVNVKDPVYPEDQYCPDMQLTEDVEYTFTTSDYTADDKFDGCYLSDWYAEEEYYYELKKDSISIEGLDTGVTWAWDEDNHQIKFSKPSSVTNLKVKFKIKSGTGDINNGWFGLTPHYSDKEIFVRSVAGVSRQFCYDMIGARYQRSDITSAIINGKTVSGVNLRIRYGNNTIGNTRSCSITNLVNGDEFVDVASYEYMDSEYFEDYLLDAEEGHTVYTFDDDKISYVTDKATQEDYSIKELEFNSYGYITKYTYYLDGKEVVNSFTYSNEPIYLKDAEIIYSTLYQELRAKGIEISIPDEFVEDKNGTYIIFKYNSATLTNDYTININVYNKDESVLIEDLGNIKFEKGKTSAFAYVTFTKWDDIWTGDKLVLKGA